MAQQGVPARTRRTAPSEEPRARHDGRGSRASAGATHAELLPTREPLRTIFRYIGFAEQAIAVGCMVVILILVLLQVRSVTCRTVAGRGPVRWLSLALVWLAFILSGYLMAMDRHITIQLVDYFLPPRAAWLR